MFMCLLHICDNKQNEGIWALGFSGAAKKRIRQRDQLGSRVKAVDLFPAA